MNMRHFSITKWLVLITIAVSLTGCIRPFKFDVEQGNDITPETIMQISPGMSESEVRSILGTPMLNDVFHAQRWDYVYFERTGKGKETRMHLAVFFEDGRVVNVRRDPVLKSKR